MHKADFCNGNGFPLEKIQGDLNELEFAQYFM